MKNFVLLAALATSASSFAMGANPNTGNQPTNSKPAMICAQLHSNADGSMTCETPRVLYKSKYIRLHAFLTSPKHACQFLFPNQKVLRANSSYTFTDYHPTERNIFGPILTEVETVNIGYTKNKAVLMGYEADATMYTNTLNCTLARR